MSHRLAARTLFSVALLGSASVPTFMHPGPVSAALTSRATAASGTDLVQLDTHTEHYTQAADGLTRVQLYNSPVGIPGRNGWRLRDPRLGALSAAGIIAPADVPFDLRIATTSTGPALAALDNEDGVSLAVGLASVGGAAPAAVAGQVGDGVITYSAVVSSTTPLTPPPTATAAPTATAPTAAAGPATAAPAGTVSSVTPGNAMAAGVDLSLRPTVSGLDARIVLHNAGDPGPFVFTLTLDPRTYLVQDANGVIHVTRPITAYGDDGAPYVIQASEYRVQPPIAVDSSADPVAPVSAGPATMTLLPPAAGRQQVSVRIDPSWLQDPARILPVHLDLPIVTAYSAVHTGLFGTVNSCAPDLRAPLTAVVVGAQKGCLYHGLAYFDTSALLPNTPIVSAMLRLYTPEQTGTINVQVYPNAPVSDAARWQQPSWNSAPAVVTGAAGIAQSGSAGHWQSWDVTSLVRQWVQNAWTNGGVTLVGSGAPVLFASLLGAGGADPASAPYLDIIYGPRTAGPTSGVASGFVDHAASIYGLSGTFSANYNKGSYSANGYPYPNCGSNECNAATKMPAVSSAQTAGVGGAFVRASVELSCASSTPGPAWWENQNGNNADPNNYGSIADILWSARQDGLIPIVDILPNGSCLQYATPGSWYSQTRNLVQSEARYMPPTIYFEIGNEENENPASYGGNSSWSDQANYQAYARIFASAAQGLRNTLLGSGISNYLILTGGELEPTATTDPTQCTDPSSKTNPYALTNYEEAQQAIQAAEKTYYVSPQHLGVGIHPYKYTTNDSYYWRNYHYWVPYDNPCLDLGGMFTIWTTAQYIGGLPIVFTEVNWTDQAIDNTTNEEAYLVDLLTWLYDRPGSGSSYANPNNSPAVRVMWFRGNDADTPLGIWHGGSAEKYPSSGIANCPNDSSNAGGVKSLSNDYYQLRHAACY